MKAETETLPRTVFLFHADDTIDLRGLTFWLATSMNLVGMILVKEDSSRRSRVLRNEYKRSGVLGLLDALAFRAYYPFSLAKKDADWINEEAARLKERYPGRHDGVPQIVVTNPNSDEARRFLMDLKPDVMVARCKFILKPAIYDVPKHGTFVLHPGICPEYRNSHGCFWAMAERDLERVGMTLLKVDRGVDTGPVYLQAGCEFDEVRESHVIIQYRVITENLDRIADTLKRVCAGQIAPIPTAGRKAGVWGQPRFTAYWRWKRQAQRKRHDTHRLPALS